MSKEENCINLHGKVGALGFIGMMLFTILFGTLLVFPPFPISYQYTYELLFGPSTLIGYLTLFIVIIQSARISGFSQAIRILIFAVILWAVANFIDFWLIYFEAWTFNPLRHTAEMLWPFLPKQTFFKNPMHIPTMEVYGFNMIIAWVVLFLSATIMSFVNKITIIVEPKGCHGKTMKIESN